MLGEPRVENAEMALRFESIAVKRVLDLFGRGVTEMHRLPGIGSNAGGNEHQPRQKLAAHLFALRRQELAGLLGEIEQDRVGVEHGDVTVNDRRYLRVGIDRKKFRSVLIALAGIDRMR